MFSVTYSHYSAVHSCHCYTPSGKMSHLMGTTGIGITRAWALSRVLPLPRTLQSWDLGLLIPTVPQTYHVTINFVELAVCYMVYRVVTGTSALQLIIVGILKQGGNSEHLLICLSQVFS